MIAGRPQAGRGGSLVQREGCVSDAAPDIGRSECKHPRANLPEAVVTPFAHSPACLLADAVGGAAPVKRLAALSPFVLVVDEYGTILPLLDLHIEPTLGTSIFCRVSFRGPIGAEL